MRPFALCAPNLQLVRLDEGGAVHSVPVGDGLVVFGGIILAAVFEADYGIPAEKHKVGQEKPVSGFYLVLLVLRLLGIASAGGMPGEGQRHVLAAPIISAPAPFLGAGALRLRRLAVVEEEPGIAFQRAEHRAVGEYPGGAHQMPRPIATAFGVARIEEDQILARLGSRVIAIGRVKVADVRRGISIWLATQRPANLEGSLAGVSQLDAGRTEKRHGEVTCEMNLLSFEAHIDWEGFDQIFAIIPIIECAGTEEEGDRRVDGGDWRSIPDNSEFSATELYCPVSGDGELQRPQH